MSWIAALDLGAPPGAHGGTAVAAASEAVRAGAVRVWALAPLEGDGADDTAVAAAIAAHLPAVRVGIATAPGGHLLWFARRLGTLASLSEGRLDLVWRAGSDLQELLWLRTLWRVPGAARELGIEPAAWPGGEPQVWLEDGDERLAAELAVGRVHGGEAIAADGTVWPVRRR